MLSLFDTFRYFLSKYYNKESSLLKRLNQKYNLPLWATLTLAVILISVLIEFLIKRTVKAVMK